MIASFKLKNGHKISVDPLNRSTNARELSNFINNLIDEKVYITRDKKISYDEQKEEIELSNDKIKAGNIDYLLAWDDGNIVGQVIAQRLSFRLRANLFVRLYVAKKYRRLGLGEKMMLLLIKRLMNKKNTRNFYVEVAKKNKGAIALYKKLGFKKTAELPNWMIYENKYLDAIGMILDVKHYVKQ